LAIAIVFDIELTFSVLALTFIQSQCRLTC
jgi:hypothetical protein